MISQSAFHIHCPTWAVEQFATITSFALPNEKVLSGRANPFMVKEPKDLAALVLVGGYGVRLQPLTFTRAKPLVEFCNRPMVEYILDALVKVGVTKIVFALSILQEDLKAYITEYTQRNTGATLIPSLEAVRLGTAGPIHLAKQHLQGRRFFMVNSDIISGYPFQGLLDFHLKHPGEGTIMSWEVEDPSRFGVIVQENSKIQRFVEKPVEPIGNSINAGLYVFEPSMVDRICSLSPEPTEISIEREVFPQMAAEGQLYVQRLEGIWMDIGTPPAFIECIPIFLAEANVLIDPAATIGSNSQIGPNVVVGPGCRIGAGCSIQNAVILRDAQVDDNCVIADSIVGWESRIEQNVNLSEKTVLGQKVVVRQGLTLKGVLAVPQIVIDQEVAPGKVGDWAYWEAKVKSGV
jgi:mannose-1-phosphate guanylyltransferase